LREMLEVSTEKRDDKVVLELKEDVTPEVIDQFLTFLYSGKLKDIRQDIVTVDPTWVEVLPELFQMADKVSSKNKPYHSS